MNNNNIIINNNNINNNITHMFLVVGKVFLELIKLLLEHLHVFKVLSVLVEVQERLLVIDPEEHLLTLTHKLNESQCLLQLQTLVLKFLEQ